MNDSYTDERQYGFENGGAMKTAISAEINKQQTQWRFLIGWSEAQLQRKLQVVKQASVNFPTEGPESQMGTHWRRYYSESVVGQESPGAVEERGVFLSLWEAISQYKFSDPDIVEGHYNPDDPLQNRTLLLEIKVLGLRYLCGVRVRAVKKEVFKDKTVYGFRYDTLVGHMEKGSEWFLLTKMHQTGEIYFRISASWRPGAFPNWWSRVGFYLLSERYQLLWHRLAYKRLRNLAGSGFKLKPIPRGRGLVHTGPEVNSSEIWQDP